MIDVAGIINELPNKKNSEKIKGMSRIGIDSDSALRVSIPNF